ncbi:hypothetical protein NA56DRAFT_346131 [Hyaloscypha hepaticicola]|uniref:Uncharacterized protein n=1 Tax=Hyaloscypha hepaticicola TaxID=2082293 RepID=A0A2J6PMW3_9HELO|nr:hypothetical protein NA56DRAFT_346131 [Hyaloscypha hepaticicola]
MGKGGCSLCLLIWFSIGDRSLKIRSFRRSQETGGSERKRSWLRSLINKISRVLKNSLRETGSGRQQGIPKRLCCCVDSTQRT